MTTKTEEPITTRFPPIARATWQKQVEKDLKGAAFARLRTTTLDGIVLEPLYTSEDVAATDEVAGLPPYRRGTHALGQADGRWDLRQAYANPDPSKVGEEIGQDLSRGGHSVWLCLDQSVRLGQSPPTGDGMTCPNLGALAKALDKVSLPQTAISLDAGANTLPAAAQLFALAEQRGVPFPKLSGALNCDPLGALARDGALPYTLPRSIAHLTTLAAFCLDRAPNLRAVGVSLVPYHNGGASPAQEIGFALAQGLYYLKALTAAGLSCDDAASQIQFTVPIGTDFFMEIAKLRALRSNWAQLVAHCQGSADAQRIAVHAVTSTFTKTRRDPYVNMLRVTTEAFAAAVGGVDSLSTAGFDVAYGPSDGFARRIASNTQVILNEESHVTRVADPAGGSYYVEHLTNELAQAGYARFRAVEQAGGMERALREGLIAREIQAIHEAREKDLRKRKQAITGVSEFANVDEKPIDRPAPDLTHLEVKRLDHKPTVETQQTGAALLASVMAATVAGATIAGLTDVLGHGEEGATMPAISAQRQAAPYENLRDRCDAHAAKTGQRPTAFLCNLGSIPEHKARSSFASGFLHAGGFACLDNDGFADQASLLAAFQQTGSKVAVVCGTDAQYGEWVPSLAPALKAAGATHVLVAGRGGDQERAFRDAGVTEFIFMGADVVATLNTLLTALGVQ